MLISSRMRVVSALVLAGALTTLVGCAGEPHPQSSASVAADSTLAEVDAPPTAPQTIHIDGLEIDALSSIWLDQGTGEFSTTGDPKITAFDLPSVAAAPELTFVLRDQSIPAGISVREFGSVDAQGIPQDSMSGVDCTNDTACAVTTRPGQVEVTLPIRTEAAFVTIDVYYDIPQLDLEQPYDLVSYGLNVRRM